MRPINTVILLLVAFLAVFLQARINFLRAAIGAQVDLLPSLVVYASLSCGWATLSLLAVVGGLLLDSLSANPLGVSVLPLFVIGLLIQRYRGLILREQTYAQWVLGAGASAAAPLMTLLLLLNTSARPLLGWFSLWQWVVMTISGAAITPLWFAAFDRLNGLFNYTPIAEASFRLDRQIKRGK